MIFHVQASLKMFIFVSKAATVFSTEGTITQSFLDSKSNLSPGGIWEAVQRHDRWAAVQVCPCWNGPQITVSVHWHSDCFQDVKSKSCETHESSTELLLVCIRQKSIRSQFRTTWSQVFSQCESQHGITGEHGACNFSTSICWAAPNFSLNLWQTCAGTLPWPWAPTAECGTECGRVRPRSRTHIYLLIHHVLMASDLLLCVFTLLHSQVHFFLST